VRWLKSSDSFLVLWDRYVASAMAYRFADAAAASLDAAEVLRFVSLVNGVCPAPSLTVFLDIPPSASVNRQEDVTNEDFLHLVQLGYERYFAQSDQPVVTVDGTMPPEHVVNAALSGIAQAGII
jgi:thymidylate kinase